MRKVNNLIQDAVASFLRVSLIFAFLMVMTDSLTRVYYSYMPIDTWVRFQSITVENRDGEAYAIIRRNVRSPQVATFYRSLIITYPEPTRACTNSLITIIDGPEVEVAIPMRRLLSATCPDVLQGRKVEGRLQVSYIFDFPYGVKRSVVRYSPTFAMIYSKGVYSVSSTQHAE